MSVRVLKGDCRDMLLTLERESFDAVITDPPYGLKFMGKAWDHGVPGAPFWVETLRVTKPGAYLVAFGGTRKFHRLTCAIEDAGWEIRDCLSWLYGSGFPKSKKLGEGRGTALKPGWEPIILARAPIAETISANLKDYGTGALNVDACRLPVSDSSYAKNCSGDRGHQQNRIRQMEFSMTAGKSNDLGRWPANVVLDEEAAALLDEQTGTLVSGANPTKRGGPKFRTAYGEFQGQPQCTPARGADRGGPSRFFYCAKASRSERDAGLDGLPKYSGGSNTKGYTADVERGVDRNRAVANHHPTVKPISLIRWLCRLVCPPGGIVLDPFIGSGTTACAAAMEGLSCVGIESDPAYTAIARARAAHWLSTVSGEVA